MILRVEPRRARRSGSAIADDIAYARTDLLTGCAPTVLAQRSLRLPVIGGLLLLRECRDKYPVIDPAR